MSRFLNGAALAVSAALTVAAAHAAGVDDAASAPKSTQGAKSVKSHRARKPVRTAQPPAEAPDDHLDPARLSLASRVLTGLADCELKQKVDLEPLPGHAGNFRLTFDHRSYVMVPEETTTGAVRLVDTGGAMVWVQIPRKSMLLNQKEHHRLVDDCEEAEQRVATQAEGTAAANAPVLAPAVATPSTPPLEDLAARSAAPAADGAAPVAQAAASGGGRP